MTSTDNKDTHTLDQNIENIDHHTGDLDNHPPESSQTSEEEIFNDASVYHSFTSFSISNINGDPQVSGLHKINDNDGKITITRFFGIGNIGDMDLENGQDLPSSIPGWESNNKEMDGAIHFPLFPFFDNDRNDGNNPIKNPIGIGPRIDPLAYKNNYELKTQAEAEASQYHRQLLSSVLYIAITVLTLLIVVLTLVLRKRTAMIQRQRLLGINRTRTVGQNRGPHENHGPGQGPIITIPAGHPESVALTLEKAYYGGGLDELEKLPTYTAVIEEDRIKGQEMADQDATKEADICSLPAYEEVPKGAKL